MVGGGKYYFNTTLTLGPTDSGVRWIVRNGESVTVSGGVRLRPRWVPWSKNPKILVARVDHPSGLQSEPEQAFWRAKKSKHTAATNSVKDEIDVSASSSDQDRGEPHNAPPTPPPQPHKWGPPPAKWNTLHVDGVRQVRARFPNANPQDNSGKCFSKVQHPETESCDGWLTADGQAGTLPGSTVLGKVSCPVDRNTAPLSPTDGSDSCGTFSYTLYDPPKGHPVYNRPLPDWGWGNNSFFGFWDDPLTRAGGLVHGGAINKTYANAATAVVHMVSPLQFPAELLAAIGASSCPVPCACRRWGVFKR